MSQSRSYRVAGHGIRVILEAPWRFKALTKEQEEVVAKLAAGGDVGVVSVPADRQELLEENASHMAATRSASPYELDFLQYEPFADEVADPLMTMTVKPWTEPLPGMDSWELLLESGDQYPIVRVLKAGERLAFQIKYSSDRVAGTLLVDRHAGSGEYFAAKGTPELVLSALNTAIMLQFTVASAPYGTLLMHASVTRYMGKANVFFGVSGTGKSTHSRLWHEHVPGCDLMNDDNPVLRLSPDGTPLVYGSPWSGKTLCYRNVSAPAGAFVRLEQAPDNKISKLKGLEAYASVIGSVSSMRWDREFMNNLVKTVETVAMSVPCYRLECRPDREAVIICKNAIS